MKNSKVICILATYKRNKKCIRFLNQFKQHSAALRHRIRVLIVDDDPNSPLASSVMGVDWGVSVEYQRNASNLGQGQNQLAAVRNLPYFTYIWMPGDDDLVVMENFLDVLLAIENENPCAAIMGFRQGKKLQSGTNFSGPARQLKNKEEAILKGCEFGKCTNVIFRRPNNEFLDFMEVEMQDCMYPDKAMVVNAILKFNNIAPAYINPEICAYADQDFGKLRYSTRVFANLPAVVEHTAQYHEFPIKLGKMAEKKKRNVFRLWVLGLYFSLSEKHAITYTSKKFLLELFFGPIIVCWGFIKKRRYQRP